MRGPLWAPEEGDRYVEGLVDIVANPCPVPLNRMPSKLDGYQGGIVWAETVYVRPGPLGQDVWWPTGGSGRPLWNCAHDHATEAEALTCAYQRLEERWPAQ